MSSSVPNISELLQSAYAEGELSTRGLQTLSVNADIGTQIQAGLGIALDDVPSAEVVLVTMMPDDSGSIRFAGHADTVRNGHNLVLDALRSVNSKLISWSIPAISMAMCCSRIANWTMPST